LEKMKEPFNERVPEAGSSPEVYKKGVEAGPNGNESAKKKAREDDGVK